MSYPYEQKFPNNSQLKRSYQYIKIEQEDQQQSGSRQKSYKNLFSYNKNEQQSIHKQKITRINSQVWNHSIGSSSKSRSISQSPNELKRYMKEYSYNCNDHIIGRSDSKRINNKPNYINSPAHINSVELTYKNSVQPAYNNSVEPVYNNSVKTTYKNSVDKKLFQQNKNQSQLKKQIKLGKIVSRFQKLTSFKQNIPFNSNKSFELTSNLNKSFEFRYNLNKSYDITTSFNSLYEQNKYLKAKCIQQQNMILSLQINVKQLVYQRNQIQNKLLNQIQLKHKQLIQLKAQDQLKQNQIKYISQRKQQFVDLEQQVNKFLYQNNQYLSQHSYLNHQASSSNDKLKHTFDFITQSLQNNKFYQSFFMRAFQMMKIVQNRRQVDNKSQVQIKNKNKVQNKNKSQKLYLYQLSNSKKCRSHKQDIKKLWKWVKNICREYQLLATNIQSIK